MSADDAAEVGRLTKEVYDLVDAYNKALELLRLQVRAPFLSVCL